MGTGPPQLLTFVLVAVLRARAFFIWGYTNSMLQNGQCDERRDYHEERLEVYIRGSSGVCGQEAGKSSSYIYYVVFIPRRDEIRVRASTDNRPFRQHNSTHGEMVGSSLVLVGLAGE